MTGDALPNPAGAGCSPAGERLLRAFARELPPDPTAALTRLRRHKVPATVVAAFTDDIPEGLASAAEWQAAVRADVERTARLHRAARIVEEALAGIEGLAMAGDGLGTEWSTDIDVFATPEALTRAGAALRDGGAIALDELAGRLRGARRPSPPVLFAIVDGFEVLAPAELSRNLWDSGEPAAPAIHRARRRSGGLPRLLADDAARRRVSKLGVSRRATVRGAVELSALLEQGLPMPAGASAGSALRRHARLERLYGGPGPVSAAAAKAGRRPSPEWLGARVRAVGREGRRRLRSGQVRVAFCGIDGAGKSTQVRLLVDNLGRVGIGAQPSWTRIGNAASGPVEILARVAQRLLPRGSHSFQATRAAAGRRATATGEDPHAVPPAVTPPLTRRGPLGWGWALAVTLDYLYRSRTAARRAGGSVLVLDRALPDALVELQDDYGVALRLRLQRRLLVRFAPAPHLTCYLRLPGAVAKARKDDMFTAAELDRQIDAYEREIAALPELVVLDAQRAPDELALEALRSLAAPGRARTSRALCPPRPSA